MSIYAALSAFREQHPRMRPDRLVRAFVMATPDADPYKLFEQELGRIDRQRARLAEIAQLRTFSEKSSFMASAAAEPGWTEELRRSVYRLGDATTAEFGQMTADQHRLRARLLRQHAAGTVRAAELHERAAEDIEAAGVLCIDDISAEALAA